MSVYGNIKVNVDICTRKLIQIIIIFIKIYLQSEVIRENL
jgi:hypothetical protein